MHFKNKIDSNRQFQKTHGKIQVSLITNIQGMINHEEKLKIMYIGQG